VNGIQWIVKLNLSHIRLLRYLMEQKRQVTVGGCEAFLLETKISLSTAKKYIQYMKDKKLIHVVPNPADKRSKLVSLSSTVKGIDQFI
jgi:DNA-binding MarR family transcriptional regulator